MNKTEAAYAELLEAQRVRGEVWWWGFEVIALRLADRTFYHPDFLVLAADGGLEVHETKGFMRDDANVKLKVAAALFPFRFRLVRRIKGRWEFTDYSPARKARGSDGMGK